MIRCEENTRVVMTTIHLRECTLNSLKVELRTFLNWPYGTAFLHSLFKSDSRPGHMRGIKTPEGSPAEKPLTILSKRNKSCT